MLLELKKATMELKDLLQKASEIGKSLQKLGFVLREKAAESKPSPEKYPHLKTIVNFDKILELTARIANLEAKRFSLEKKLGTKVTLE